MTWQAEGKGRKEKNNNNGWSLLMIYCIQTLFQAFASIISLNSDNFTTLSTF